MNEVVKWRGLVYGAKNPADVLEKAKGWGMEGCLIVGFNAEGHFIWGSSLSEIDKMNLMLDLAKRELLRHVLALPNDKFSGGPPR